MIVKNIGFTKLYIYLFSLLFLLLANVFLVFFLQNTLYFIVILVFSIISSMILLALTFYEIRQNIAKPLLVVRANAMQVSRGELPQKTLTSQTNIITEIDQLLHKTGSFLQEMANFTREIGKGNLEVEFALTNKKNVLGLSLIEMATNWKIHKTRIQFRIKEQKQKTRKYKNLLQSKEQDLQNEISKKETALQNAYIQLINTGNELKQNAEQVLATHQTLYQTKQELEQKNKDLENLNKEKNHLIRVVAHDLRNPLTSGLCVVDLFDDEAELLNEEQKEYLSIIKNSMLRMNNMISQILDIEMIESKAMNVQLEIFDFAHVITELKADFEKLANRKNINLSISLEPSWVHLDRMYLTQIVENLLSNAIKFSPFYKNVFVKLFIKQDKARLEVRDEGSGIGADDMSKLFGKFQRLSASPTGGEKSTGLGLSIVKKYVESMNGRVWCESELGKGANFIVEFPTAEPI